MPGGGAWSLSRGRSLDFGEPCVMGVLNTTPDSFYDGGRYVDAGEAAARGLQMVAEGARVIDVGGESSRPPVYGAAQAVGEDEEIRRVVPAIEALRRESDIPISIDTTKARVARAALDAGADIVNDISALEGEAMPELLAGGDVPVILMHRRGIPATMQADTHYDDLVAEVRLHLELRVTQALEAGAKHVATDPGVGFGKSVDGNYQLLRHAGDFSIGGCPVLIGASRKSFLWKPAGSTPDRAGVASVAAAVLAAEHGARILRVHDVADTVDALRVWSAVRRAQATAVPEVA